jgi:hypothetical protein
LCRKLLLLGQRLHLWKLMRHHRRWLGNKTLLLGVHARYGMRIARHGCPEACWPAHRWHRARSNRSALLSKWHVLLLRLIGSLDLLLLWGLVLVLLTLHVLLIVLLLLLDLLLLLLEVSGSLDLLLLDLLLLLLLSLLLCLLMMHLVIPRACLHCRVDWRETRMSAGTHTACRRHLNAEGKVSSYIRPANNIVSGKGIWWVPRWVVKGILHIFLTQSLSFVVISVSGDAPLYQASKLPTGTFDRWATCAH